MQSYWTDKWTDAEYFEILRAHQINDGVPWPIREFDAKEAWRRWSQSASSQGSLAPKSLISPEKITNPSAFMVVLSKANVAAINASIAANETYLPFCISMSDSPHYVMDNKLGKIRVVAHAVFGWGRYRTHIAMRGGVYPPQQMWLVWVVVNKEYLVDGPDIEGPSWLAPIYHDFNINQKIMESLVSEPDYPIV